MITLLSVILLSTLLNGYIVYAVRKNIKYMRETRQDVENFFKDNGQTGGSDFSQLLNATISTMNESIASSVTTSLSMALKGAKGGTMKGVNAQLESIAIDNNPQLGIWDMLPKSTKKNPLAKLGLSYLVNNPDAVQNVLGGMNVNKNNNDIVSLGDYQGRKHKD